MSDSKIEPEKSNVCFLRRGERTFGPLTPQELRTKYDAGKRESSSVTSSSQPAVTRSRSSGGKTIDDIHYEAFRQDEIRAGRDPDIQSESTIRAANKILRDAGEW